MNHSGQREDTPNSNTTAGWTMATSLNTTTWKMVTGVSTAGSKTPQVHKPSQPRVGPIGRKMGILGSSTGNTTNIKQRLARATDTQPRAQRLPVALLGSKIDPCRPGVATKEVTALPMRRGISPTNDAPCRVKGVLVDGDDAPADLPRSGSAPCSSETATPVSPSIAASLSFPAGTRTSLPRYASGAGPQESKPTSTRTAKSCWGENVDPMVPFGSETHRRDGEPQTGKKAAFSLPESKQGVYLLQGSPRNLNRGGGWKDAPPDSRKRKQNLVPLHRRKSDAAGGVLAHFTRVKTSSIGFDVARAGRRRSCTAIDEGPRPSSTHTEGGAAARGRPLKSDAMTGTGVGRGQLKARMRVMEWKRRRAEESKVQEGEQATLEQKARAEVILQTARSLAAGRAEQAERRNSVEREKTSDTSRLAENAEKWAKASRQRERRRAEIYAINAVMRAAFEKEFKAFSLEKKRQAHSPPSSPGKKA